MADTSSEEEEEEEEDEEEESSEGESGSESEGEDSEGGDDDDEEDGEGQAQRKRAAWVDEDDETVTVSLASEKRVRKLRRTEEEDVLTGAEYTERLRERFAQTYSAHQSWAQAREADDENGILQWAGTGWCGVGAFIL